VFLCSLLVGIVVCHRLLDFDRVPMSMILLLCVIITLVSMNVALHCASQSWPTNSSDVVPRSGKIWAVIAALGKCGKFNLAVCVAFMMLWFGRWTLIPCFLFFYFCMGLLLQENVWCSRC